MMGEKDAAAVSALCHARKKFVTGLASSRLDRHLFFCGEHANIRRADFKIDIVARREFFDKMRVGVARSAAQLMIQVGDSQVSVTKIDERTQERNGISAAGDADEVAFVRRKVAQEA